MREGREVGRGSAVKVKETQISSRRSTIKKKEVSRGPSILVRPFECKLCIIPLSVMLRLHAKLAVFAVI